MSKLPLTSVRKRKSSSKLTDKAAVVDLERYVPAFLTWIANKLSGGASTAYLSAFNVGIETWRLLVLLAIEKSLTAQAISRTIGMDKSSVSRAFKSMQLRGLITISLDDADGRLRVATITTKGRALHDEILELAMERERAFLSVLNEKDRETLICLLRRLHDNLPVVEKATQEYLAIYYPKSKSRRAVVDAE
jgi:DNA-binding MarR family transcriptional regulator